MTLLDSVKRVHRMLRVDPPTSISSTDLLAQTIVDYLNQSADEILNSYNWSFLKRDDGKAFFPGKLTITSGVAVVRSSQNVTIRASANEMSSDYANAIHQNPVRMWGQFSDNTGEPETAYSFIHIINNALFQAKLVNEYMGALQLGSLVLYAYEHGLPATVRRVLSVVYQEDPVQLVFTNRHTVLDPAFPRKHDVFRDRPEFVSVGGTIRPTVDNASTEEEQLECLAIWPPPDGEMTLDYSYLYRHPALAEDADQWLGVPSEMITEIEWGAFAKALSSDVQDDPDRATQVAIRNARSLQLLKHADARDPYRKYVPREIGDPRGSRYRSRWDSLTVPEPS
jgi:hypothetical protein